MFYQLKNNYMSIFNSHSEFNRFKTFSGNGEISLYNSASAYIVEKKIKKMFDDKINNDNVQIFYKENLTPKESCISYVYNRVEKINDVTTLRNMLSLLEIEGCQAFFLYLKEKKYKKN